MEDYNPNCVNTTNFKSRCSKNTNRDFEWTWDKSLSNDYVDLVNNDRDVRFHHHISNGTAVVRGSKPLLSDQHFWEVEMISPVYGTDMMIGVGTPEADVSLVQDQFISFLGMNNQTWGLSYTGLFHHNGESRAYSFPFGQGSVIGVHLDLWNGTLSYYKNRKHLGIATRGLKGKTLYAMACSTAACSGMRIVSSCSFPSSLQFLCCAKLRDIIPDKKSVLKELQLPPGLRLFLANNLSWLLDPRHTEAESIHARQRRRNQWVSSGIPATNHFMFHENNVEIETTFDLNADTSDAADTFYVVGRRPFILCRYNRFQRDSDQEVVQPETPESPPQRIVHPELPDGSLQRVFYPELEALVRRIISPELPDSSEDSVSDEEKGSFPVSDAKCKQNSEIPKASKQRVVSPELPDNSEASTSDEKNDSFPESDAKRRRYPELPEDSVQRVVSPGLPDNFEAGTSGEENDSLPESDAKRRRYSYNYLVGLSDPDSE